MLFALSDGQSDLSDSGVVVVSGTTWCDDDAAGSPPLPELSTDERLKCPAWWPCRVQKVRDGMAAIKLHIEAPPAGDMTPAEAAVAAYLATVTDIVGGSVLRHPRHRDGDDDLLTPSMIHRHQIDIPKELSDLYVLPYHRLLLSIFSWYGWRILK